MKIVEQQRPSETIIEHDQPGLYSSTLKLEDPLLLGVYRENPDKVREIIEECLLGAIDKISQIPENVNETDALLEKEIRDKLYDGELERDLSDIFDSLPE